MTTATTTTASPPGHPRLQSMPDGLVSFLGSALAALSRVDPAIPPDRQWASRPTAAADRPPPRWLQPTIRRMLDLPWDDNNWNDDAKPADPNAAANLLILLAHILDDAAPTPIIVPTWRGGAQAEWHMNDVDLEIEVDPDGTIYYSFENPIEECEGPVGDDLSDLRGYVAHLPRRFSENGGAR